jgi:hypothetical protein
MSQIGIFTACHQEYIEQGSPNAGIIAAPLGLEKCRCCHKNATLTNGGALFIFSFKDSNLGPKLVA